MPLEDQKDGSGLQQYRRWLITVERSVCKAGFYHASFQMETHRPPVVIVEILKIYLVDQYSTLSTYSSNVNYTTVISIGFASVPQTCFGTTGWWWGKVAQFTTRWLARLSAKVGILRIPSVAKWQTALRY